MRATGARTDERPRRKRGPDFSGAAGKGESENPGDARFTSALWTSHGHFFGDFLCASKESYPPQAEALFLEARSKVAGSLLSQG